MRRSGKTHALINLLNDTTFKKQFASVYLFSETVLLDDNWRQLSNQKVVKYNTFEEERIRRILEIQENAPAEVRENVLIILDDFVEKFTLKKADLLNSLATKGRHFKVSYIFTSQKYKSISPIIRLNSSEVILFKIPNRAEFETVVSDFDDIYLNTTNIEKILKFATREPYDYLLITRGQQTEYFKGNNQNIYKIKAN